MRTRRRDLRMSLHELGMTLEFLLVKPGDGINGFFG